MAQNEANDSKAKAPGPMDKVMVLIPHRYDDDATGVRVNVNTRNFFVPFNTPVEVPRFIAEVAERSLRSDREAFERRKAAQEAKCLGGM